MIAKKELEQVRKQLLKQVDLTFPNDKKEFAKKQIINMNDSQLIDFLQKNRLLKVPEQSSAPPEQQMQAKQCVFCSIVRNEIDSYKIDENKDNIAVLEINPVSKGHVLIIPKQHIESSGKLPQSTFSLAKKIAKKIKSKLKPKEVQINASNLFGHEVVNVFPIYNNESLKSQRYQENKKVLEKLKKKLEKKATKKKPKKIIKKTQKPEKTKGKIRIPKRIP